MTAAQIADDLDARAAILEAWASAALAAGQFVLFVEYWTSARTLRQEAARLRQIAPETLPPAE